MKKPAVTALLAIAALGLAVTLCAQGAPPPFADSEHPVPPAFTGVRRAWLVPEEDLRAALQSPNASLDQFAVAAMVSHDTGKPVGETEKWRIQLGSWTEVIRTRGQYLKDIVFKGSARYNLEALPEFPSKEGLARCEARIAALAQVMTLERLTGKAPAVIARDMQAGKAFEDLLIAAMPANPATAPAKRQQDGPPKDRHREKGPPGMGFDEPTPGGHGHVGSGLGR